MQTFDELLTSDVASPAERGKRTREALRSIAAERLIATIAERQRIIAALLRQADTAHDLRNYHDRDRYRDAAWLAERA